MGSLMSSTFLAILISLHFSNTSAQTAAPGPAPSGPTDITAILGKAGQYTTLIRLLKSTEIADRINSALNKGNQGITIMAPTDAAFSNLKPGTLNSLTDQQKVQLVQFHVIPSFLTVQQFQTLSNPVRTEAGGSDWQFPLNVTTSGSEVNITTGLTNATLGNTVYTDKTQLAVYQMDQVLLPLDVFMPRPPPPAPAPSKSKKAAASAKAPSGTSEETSVKSSGIKSLIVHKSTMLLYFGVALLAATLLSVS
ncbi:FAS1 domain [Dillenia turbinata]|uniref:FAS1 domain n=1 Tax=Dillenia turbinata TaxID=194707 RepID=A0AAN8ZM27_9MAGN